MTIHFHCECGQKLKASSESIGKMFGCPVCGTKVTVPPTDEVEVEAHVLAAKSVSQRTAQSVGPNGRAKPGERVADEVAPETPVDEVKLDESDTREFASGDTKEFESPRDPKPAKRVQEPVSRREKLKEHPQTPVPSASPAVNTGYERLNPIYERVHAASPRQEETYPAEPLESASGADTARDLYRLVRKMKKDGKADAVAKPKKKRSASGEEGTDYGALFVELGRTVVPGIAGVALVCFLAYWLSSTVMSSGRGLPELGDVRGRITLDGEPLAGATVTFIPVPEDDETASRISSSVGMTDESGRYELMYVQDVDGAAVGTHQVSISLPLPNGAEKLPRRYNSATELSFVVESGKNSADFELVTKK